MFSCLKKVEHKVHVDKRRLERALWEAENAPESKTDLSACGLAEVPTEATRGLLARKESLLLQDNMLECLPHSLVNLTQLRVLDAHNNKLKGLPDEIGALLCLQVLNLEHNELKGLPPAIGGLISLQTLNLRHNHLTSLPAEIGALVRLRTLALDHNALKQLPLELARVQALDTLTVEGNQLVFPTASTSTESMMRQLCQAAEGEKPASRLSASVLSIKA